MAAQLVQRVQALVPAELKSVPVSIPVVYVGPTRYTQFLNGEDDDMPKRLLFAMYVALDNILTGANLADVDNQVDAAGVGVAIPFTFAPIISVCSKWVIDLTACHQVGKLNTSNVRNYFKGVGGDSPSADDTVAFLEYSKSRLPFIMANNDLRARVSDIAFTKYHTNASTTPELASRMASLIPEDHIHILSHDERAAITASLAARWNQSLADAIPDRVKALIRVFMDANEVEIGAYYQGTKSLSRMPASFAKAATAYFKAIASKNSNEQEFKESKSIEEVYALVPAIITRADIPENINIDANASRRSRAERYMAVKNSAIARNNARMGVNEPLITLNDAVSELYPSSM